MGKGDVFAVVSGALGFVADVITIIEAVKGPEARGAGAVPLHWPILMGMTTVYGWMILAWFLTKRRFLKDLERAKDPQFNKTVSRAVYSLGVIVLPFLMYIGYSIAEIIDPGTGTVGLVAGFFADGLIGTCIRAALEQGMPLIYDEIP